ncbi:hypothetical protein [Streptomyces katrae]|nr:hypothetical protein [Streptomyces katrae]
MSRRRIVRIERAIAGVDGYRKRAKVFSPYDALGAICATVPEYDRRWDPERKAWEVHDEHVQPLKDVFEAEGYEVRVTGSNLYRGSVK